MTDLVSLLSHASAIVGKIGSGKTYVAKGVVETLLGLGRRIVIIDPTGVWWGLRSGTNGSHGIKVGTGWALPHAGDFLGTIIEDGFVWHYFTGPANSANRQIGFHYRTAGN